MVQSFYRRLRMPPAPLTTPANQFANPGGFARTSAFRPSTLLPVDQAGNKQMSLLQKGMDMAKGPQGQSLLGALATPFATSALAGALGNTMNPNLRGLAGALKGVADRDAAEATIAGRAGKQTSAIDNYTFLQKLIEKGAPQKEIDTFRNMIQRGASILDDGTNLIAYDTRTGQEIYRVQKDATYPTQEAGSTEEAKVTAREITQQKIDKPKVKSGLIAHSQQMLVVTRAISNALDVLNDKKFVAGFTGKILAQIPGKPAFRLKQYIKTIYASSAFGALQTMRKSSPTGGALGNVSNIELDLLKNSRASIEQGTEPEIIYQELVQFYDQVTSELNSMYNMYKEIYGKATPDSDNTIDLTKPFPIKSRTFIGRDNTSEGNDDKTSEWKNLSEENKQAIIKFFKDNPTEEIKQEIIEDYGISVFNKFFGDQ